MDVDLEAAQKLCTEIKLLGVKAHAYKVIQHFTIHELQLVDINIAAFR